jgi:hypothetical protein
MDVAACCQDYAQVHVLAASGEDSRLEEVKLLPTSVYTRAYTHVYTPGDALCVGTMHPYRGLQRYHPCVHFGNSNQQAKHGLKCPRVMHLHYNSTYIATQRRLPQQEQRQNSTGVGGNTAWLSPSSMSCPRCPYKAPAAEIQQRRPPQ